MFWKILRKPFLRILQKINKKRPLKKADEVNQKLFDLTYKVKFVFPKKAT